MIATVTLNPALDKTVTLKKLVPNEVNSWTTLRRDTGGKGIGVSRVLHRLGGKTVAYGFIGGYEGMIVADLLRQERVKLDFTPIRGETRNNTIITETKTNQQTRVDAPGPLIFPQELENLCHKVCRAMPHMDFLVLSGSVPPGVPDDIYARLVWEAKSQGIKTVLDSDREWLREGLKANPYLIKPNIYELGQLLRTTLTTEEEIIQAALELAKKKVETVVVSRGKDGLIATDGTKVWKAVAPEVKVRSTTGAGDSAVAGIVLKLSQGKSLAEACAYGAAAGTAAVLTPGTQLCRRRDVERLFPQVKVEEIRL